MATTETRRRLAAIFAASAIDLAALIEADGEGRVQQLERHRREHIDPLVARYGGRVFKTSGEALLAEFASVVEAVRCALLLQDGMAKRLAGLEEGRRVRFRIGIHLGDVLAVGDDLLGDGVTVASRIAALAEPGGVILSDDACRHVAGKLPAELHDLGEHRLKNIAKPVRIHSARSLGTETPVLRTASKSLNLPDRPSIAVLPFENMSADPNQTIVCDGITEDIITDLSRFHGLFVIARDSSFVYRNRPVEIRRVGRELGVRYVLDGSVRRARDTIRITARFIEAEDGQQLWGERYDRSIDELFAVQEEVARAIVGRFAKHLEKAEVQKLRRKPPESLQAYELWLAGAELHELGTTQSHAEARALYEKSLAIDPGFARAYAGLAELAYMGTVAGEWGVAREPAYDQALEHARKAVELDAVDAHSHLVVAWAYMVRREFERARKHWEMAGELNPNDADIAMSRATAMMFFGEPEEGIAIAEQAIRLNPFCPDWYLSDKAVIRFGARDYQAALAIYDSMGELYPHSIVWHAAAAGHAGKPAEAARLVERFIARARELWVGDPAAGPADYARWLIAGFPFRHAEDAAHLAAGLSRAGLAL